MNKKEQKIAQMNKVYDLIFLDELTDHQAIDEYQQGVLLGAFDAAETQADLHDGIQHARLTQRTKKPLPYYHGNKRRF